MEIKFHSIQTKILMYLLFNPEARCSDLNTTNITTDHFNLHVKRLMGAGLVKKNASKKYQLTKKGKKFANRYDIDSASVEKQPKVAVLVFCREEKKNTTRYLVQQRLKQQCCGFCGLISGKVKWGEAVEEAYKLSRKGIDSLIISGEIKDDIKNALMGEKYSGTLVQY